MSSSFAQPLVCHCFGEDIKLWTKFHAKFHVTFIKATLELMEISEQTRWNVQLISVIVYLILL